MLDLFHNHGINVTIIAQVMSALLSCTYHTHYTVKCMEEGALTMVHLQLFTSECLMVTCHITINHYLKVYQ